MSSCSNSGIYSLKQDEVYETPATSAYEQAFETEAAEQNATTALLAGARPDSYALSAPLDLFLCLLLPVGKFHLHTLLFDMPADIICCLLQLDLVAQ